ncbi:MAG TPA: dTDP-4-dehydrorhamnose reductase [Candidatus Krumholzibacteria bacterium]|nr:dTDP-4-dehydrorhamnose reductase [Candidatus Krumholzibacteria bacterium]
MVAPGRTPPAPGARLRVAVTGAAGMLGSAVVEECRSAHEVLPLRRSDCDLADASSTHTHLAALAPDVVVHCAAWTDVDGCEGDPERAWRDNAVATENVVRAVTAARARLLLISTDYVFDGALQRPYREDDETAPINVYGRSKRAAEEHVLAMGAPGCIVRTSWVFGPGGRHFVRTMARLLRTQEEVRVVDDQVGSPTYTLDLAAALRRLLEARASGLFHVTNTGQCSWYEFAAAIAVALRFAGRVRSCRSDEFPRPARRPRNSVLDNGRYLRQGLPALRHWQEALQAYLAARPDEVAAG